MMRKPIVLFVGEDASSTQIAESLLRRLVDDRVEIRTAGTRPPVPGGREDQMLVMMGLDPAHEERLSVRALHTSDRVIILDPSLDVAKVPGRVYEEWDLTVSSIEQQVETLAATLIAGEASPGVARVGGKRRALVTTQIRRVGARAAQILAQLGSRLAAGWRRIRSSGRPST